MILAILAGAVLIMLSYVSVQTTLMEKVTRVDQRMVFSARQIAESGAAHALARVKEAGLTAPFSGDGASPEWVSFSSGAYYYCTTFNAALNVSIVRAWGRVAADPGAVASTEAPDSPSWDGTGWAIQGLEITVKGYKYIPESPLYFGNGGIERPMGGFEWTGDSDLTDPASWGTVRSSPSSYQSGWVPFESSALDHPMDFLDTGDPPAPALTNPHPYKIWASQNPIGQANIEAWFEHSAGRTSDPTIHLTPPPTNGYYDMRDPSSPDYAFPVDANVPDVLSFAWELWNRHKDDPGATKLAQGAHRGTYGDLDHPGITFVTGELRVNSGRTFSGAGILVIRDDYDPNTDDDNVPDTRARLEIDGTFEWTGLVIVAGWAPDIDVDRGADATIVGALFGEDSVQSGGEISLDSATIILTVEDNFRVLYSNELFRPGGMIHSYLPAVSKVVVGVREI